LPESFLLPLRERHWKSCRARLAKAERAPHPRLAGSVWVPIGEPVRGYPARHEATREPGHCRDLRGQALVHEGDERWPPRSGLLSTDGPTRTRLTITRAPSGGL